MKTFLATLLVASIAMAHVPVIIPSDKPHGDLPPKLERKPLPPVIYLDPVTQVPIVIFVL